MPVKYRPLCYVSDQHPWICHILFHRHFKYLLCLFTVILGLILYTGGVITMLYEIDFTEYTYPLEIDNIKSLIYEIERHHKGQGRNVIVNYSSIVSTITKYTDVKPLNRFEDIDILIDVKESCSQFWGTKSNSESQLNSNEGDRGGTRVKHERSEIVNFDRDPCLEQKQDLEPIRIFIIVKSAVNNFHRRQAIRNSWYINGQYNEFSLKTVFIVGACNSRNYVPTYLGKSWSEVDCYHQIKMESYEGDIIQGSFIDTYYNNTLKTYTTMRWINDRCRQADYILALDDDYYLELGNLLNYIKNVTISSSSNLNSTMTELYRIAPAEMALYDHLEPISEQTQCKVTNITLDNIRLMRMSSNHNLWAGFVRFYKFPFRHITSKFYLTYRDYPFNRFPPYVTGGATLLSRKTIADFYYASYFTKQFIFDDVYIGLIAYKLNIKPTHNDNFMSPLDELLENPLQNSSRIAVHDIDPDKLVDLWRKRRASMITKKNINYADKQEKLLKYHDNSSSTELVAKNTSVAVEFTSEAVIVGKL